MRDLYIKLNAKAGFNLCERTNNLKLLKYGPEKRKSSWIMGIYTL